MRGKQPYDTELMTLVAPLTTTDKGYWKTLDWEQSIALGMQAVDRPFSGRYDFVATEMTWPITHMVAPKEKALGCDSCHSRDGRMAGLTGFYMPGRDHWALLDGLGWLMVLGALAGVTLHGLGRIFTKKNNGQRKGGE